MIFDRYKDTLVGSVPVQAVSGASKLPFRIEGTIDIAAIRSESSRRAALEAMGSVAPVLEAPVDSDQFTDRSVSAVCSHHAPAV